MAKLLLEEPVGNLRQYQRQAPHQTPVPDVALPHIEGWLKENEWLERWAPKQCWTAHRMGKERRQLSIPIGESTVRMYVQERRKPSKPAYVPLDFAPGERAEFDFGEATIKINGQIIKAPFLAGHLRFSGTVCGVLPDPTNGQYHAFEIWGGVPRMAVYDTLKAAVLQVLQGHSRREQEVFLHFQSVLSRFSPSSPMPPPSGRREALRIWLTMLDGITSLSIGWSSSLSRSLPQRDLDADDPGPSFRVF